MNAATDQRNTIRLAWPQALLSRLALDDKCVGPYRHCVSLIAEVVVHRSKGMIYAETATIRSVHQPNRPGRRHVQSNTGWGLPRCPCPALSNDVVRARY
jgi:hypothetical protein